jgi:feruloyl esterase
MLLALAAADAEARHRRLPAVPCASLPLLQLPRTVITSATFVPASGSVPAYCRVLATVAPETDIEVRLPDDWQERLLQLGGSGFDGTIPNLNLNDVHLAEGFALAASNGGHRDPTGGPTRFLNQPALIEDYAHAAIEKTVRFAKAISYAYYGERPRYTYFAGCSNGGRGALNAAAKYGDEYDGVIAGAPTRNLSGLISGWARASGLQAPSPAKLASMYQAQLTQCDIDDGLVDGIIGNPDACRFEPASMRCPAGVDSASCLTDAEVEAVDTIRSDLDLDNGRMVYSRLGVGNPSRGFGVFMPLGPPGSPTASRFLAAGHLQYIVYGDPAYDPTGYDADRDFRRVRNVVEGIYDFSPDTAPLARYLRSGGKVIVWHGTEDTTLSHLDTVRSYEAMVDRAGKAGNNARLYTPPGVQHCGGGPGADGFDLIGAMRDWVEKRRAPRTLAALKFDAAGDVLFGRPLCEYPKYPRYTGGDPNGVTGFRCIAPERMPPAGRQR